MEQVKSTRWRYTACYTDEDVMESDVIWEVLETNTRFFKNVTPDVVAFITGICGDLFDYDEHQMPVFAMARIEMFVIFSEPKMESDIRKVLKQGNLYCNAKRDKDNYNTVLQKTDIFKTWSHGFFDEDGLFIWFD